jgi:hypothetical protein
LKPRPPFQLSAQSKLHIRLALRPAAILPACGCAAPSGPLRGLAADLGSTKLAFYLVNLETGATLSQTGRMNPQIVYGEDVVSRIAFANQSAENKQLLQSRLVDTVNQAVEELSSEAGVRPDEIVDSVFVGNTVMHHLFCGLPVRQLGTAPYIPLLPDHYPSVLRKSVAFQPRRRVYLPANMLAMWVPITPQPCL